ncbi:arylamine N-acetyltransferase [Sporosarcina sp. 179-K 3D1 HS]|uniref:arylamine N-acetyltransferase family protein n=1 Tax=Sporosarcina sp. 179-K 3D1 HS TaxID=3232169 RepID=UPI0039A11FEE
METTDYLKRFKAAHLMKPSLENLTELQFLHMRHIPFENLDVIRKVPIYLNVKTIYEKLVTARRGGYCYELNGLFHWLLNELGYEAHLIAATVCRPNGQWAKADTHAALIVQMGQPYLVDVGFGDSTVQPIPLDGTERTNPSGTFWVESQEDGFFDLMRRRNGAKRTLYRFSLDSKELIDFHEGCVFNQVSKESTFTHEDLATIATESGRITLSDHELKVKEDGQETNRSLTPEEKIEVLREVFGIVLDKEG